MRGKLALLVGGAAGYVLGTRAGRERYEQIKKQTRSFWQNPKVRETASHAQDVAREKAPEVKRKLSDTASHVTGGHKGESERTEDTVPPVPTVPPETYPHADRPFSG